MNASVRLTVCFALSTLSAATAASAQDDELCVGHKLLSAPRAENSCLAAQPQIVPSPDGALRAIIYPAGLDLHATADIESRVAIRADGASATLVTSRDHSLPRGANGHYVVNASWSPDSQYFAYSLSSSGGHSPWSFPIFVFCRKTGEIYSVNEMLGGKPTVSERFEFLARRQIAVTTVEQEGADRQMQAVISLDDAVNALVARMRRVEPN